MITLYQFAPAFGLPNPSSFCVKVETYLRMVGLDYVLDNDSKINRSPKEKLPFIVDDGATIGDSSLILNYLNQKYDCDLDKHLTTAQQAQLLSTKMLIEEHLYWVVVYSRWIDPVGWESIQSAFFSDLPPIVRSVVPKLVQGKITKQLYAQGIGRHTPEEIYEFAKQDIDAIATLLGNQTYFMGDKPTSLDAIAFGMLCNLLWFPGEVPVTTMTRRHQNLVDYSGRMLNQYFPEFKSVLQS